MTQQISSAELDEVVKKSPRKWVYLFSEGNAKMRDLLGGKGAGVSEMTNAGLPVTPIMTPVSNFPRECGTRRWRRSRS